MFDACTAMTTPAKDPDLVNKVTLLQKVLFLLLYKDIALQTILMKSYIFTFVILMLVAVQAIKKEKEELPLCIQQKIEEIKQQPKWNPPAEVHEYNYSGKRVFYFSSNCCDRYNMVFDDKCEYICAPSGGVTGKGDGKCADFNTKAQYVKLVWKDDRESGR